VPVRVTTILYGPAQLGDFVDNIDLRLRHCDLILGGEGRRINPRQHVAGFHFLPHLHEKLCYRAGCVKGQVDLGGRDEGTARGLDGLQLAVELFFLCQIGHHHVGKV
jgi:hypothetical protein